MFSHSLYDADSINNFEYWDMPYQSEAYPSFSDNILGPVDLSSSSHSEFSSSPDNTNVCQERLEKRGKIQERNRQAALNYRRKKKEHIDQLEYNVNKLSKENVILERQVLRLREEILNLKVILLAHRHCSHSGNINFDHLLCPT